MNKILRKLESEFSWGNVIVGGIVMLLGFLLYVIYWALRVVIWGALFAAIVYVLYYLFGVITT